VSTIPTSVVTVAYACPDLATQTSTIIKHCMEVNQRSVARIPVATASVIWSYS